MTDKYILNESGEPVAEEDLMTWARWIEEHQAKRRVAVDTVNGVRVSTIFLGLNCSFSEDGPPTLWETRIFGGPHDTWTERCGGNREQALAQHAEVLALASSV